MNDVAIHVEGLGKRYRLGAAQQAYGSLRETLSGFALAPLRLASRAARRSGGEIARRPTFWALKDVSFEVKHGEVLGIIGRNGAGKSTLLKLLSEITEPSEGRVAVQGRVASLLEVGTGFHPELSGRENIYLNGAILGMTRREIARKFDEIVAFAEVEKFIDTQVKHYSSGMYLRLAFSVAAHLEPEILVIDEVLAVGDAAFQKKCMGKMGKVADEGRTVLFVSHNLTAIRSLCSRVILLSHGTVAADGSVAEIVGKYMEDMRDATLVRDWDGESTAPQNTSITLRRVAICDDKGARMDEVFIDNPFNIEIDFSVKSDGATAGLTVIFFDSENNCVFGSVGNHEPNWYGKAMAKGDYRSICHLPANLFNNGWFSMSIILFGMGFSDAQTVRDILRIEMLDGGAVRGDFYGDYAGVVRPLLEWRTTKL